MITILPLFIVLFIGLWSGNIRRALACGIATSALIVTKLDPIDSIKLIYIYIIDNLEVPLLIKGNLWDQGNNLFIFIFLICIGILVEQLRITKGTNALIHATKSHIYNKQSTEKTSLLFSLCLCIDDYLSILAVGSIMRPLADFYKLSRARLALFVDSLAAPLVIISPISSWAAAIIGFLAESGVQPQSGIDPLVLSSPYDTFLQIIPWMFYSISLIFSIIMIQRYNITYGPLHHLEGKVMNKNYDSLDDLEKAPLLNFAIPVGSLLAFTLVALLWLGNYWILGGTNGFITSIQEAPISKCLCIAGLSSALVSLMYGIAYSQITLTVARTILISGWKLMLPCINVLLFAWTIGSLMRYELHTGQYFAQFFSEAISPQFIPFIYFALTVITAFSLGSSWASFAIFFPTTLPMLLTIYNLTPPVEPAALPLMIPSFAAILSGSVCGDHLSLISDTTSLTVTSTGCPHHDHFRSQWPMALPACLITAIAFLLIGVLDIHTLGYKYVILLTAMLCSSTALLFLFQKKLNGST